MIKQGTLLQQEVGHVTMLVNNAGVVAGRRLLNNSDDDIQHTLHVNLLAHFWVLLLFTHISMCV